MRKDRRSFLKLFGVSTAAIAAAPTIANAEPTVEIVKAEPILLPEPAPPTASPFFIRSFHRGMLDVRDQPLWSQLRIERNSMQFRHKLFQNAGPGSSIAETNLAIPGALIQPEMYCIKQIGFVFSPKTIPGLRSAFIDRYALQLFLGRKRYWEAPLSTMFSVGEPERDKDFALLPDAGFATLDIPLIIEAGSYFCVDVIGQPIHPCGRIIGWAVFKGLHAVGIQ